MEAVLVVDWLVISLRSGQILKNKFEKGHFPQLFKEIKWLVNPVRRFNFFEIAESNWKKTNNIDSDLHDSKLIEFSAAFLCRTWNLIFSVGRSRNTFFGKDVPKFFSKWKRPYLLSYCISVGFEEGSVIVGREITDPETSTASHWIYSSFVIPIRAIP